MVKNKSNKWCDGCGRNMQVTDTITLSNKFVEVETDDGLYCSFDCASEKNQSNLAQF